MGKPGKGKERLSIDVPPEEHKRIKIFAARHGMSVRLFVLESIRKRWAEEEQKDLRNMVSEAGPVLKEIWDNDKDAQYDQL